MQVEHSFRHVLTIAVCAAGLCLPAAAAAEPGSDPLTAAPITMGSVTDTVSETDTDLYATGVTVGSQVKVVVDTVGSVPAEPVAPAPVDPAQPAPTTPVETTPPAAPTPSCGVVVSLVDPDGSTAADKETILSARDAQLGLTYGDADPQARFAKPFPDATEAFGAQRHAFVRVSAAPKPTGGGCDTAAPTTYRLSLSADQPLSPYVVPVGAEIAEKSPAADEAAWTRGGITLLRGTLETVNDTDQITQELPSGTAFIVQLDPLTARVCEDASSPGFAISGAAVRRSSFSAFLNPKQKPSSDYYFQDIASLDPLRDARVLGVVNTRSTVTITVGKASCAGARYALRIQTVAAYSRPMCKAAKTLPAEIKRRTKAVATKAKVVKRMKPGAKRRAGERGLRSLRKNLSQARRKLVVAKGDCKDERAASAAVKR